MRRQEEMVERLGEMREGRREDRKKRKRQNDNLKRRA